MRSIQNMPLFHEITATEHQCGTDDEWNRQAEGLTSKLRAWLNGSRCVLVFTVDDCFHHKLYPEQIACSFFVNGHEVLVLEPEDITVKLLDTAYSSEPQYYLKTDSPADAVQAMLQGCLKNESEDILRNGDFDELALHGKFGDFIMVFHWWKEHRMAGEKDIIAHNDEIKARQEAERANSLWRKVLGEIRLALLLLGCLTLIVPLFYLARWLARQHWKGAIAVAVFIVTLWLTYLWAGSASTDTTIFLMCVSGVFITPFIAFPLLSKKPWRWLAAYAVLFFAVYFGVPYSLKYGAEKFAEKISPDCRFVVEYYDVGRTLVTSIFYNHDGSFFVKAFDKKNGRYFFTSDLQDWRNETGIIWECGEKNTVFIGNGDPGITFTLPE